MRGTEEASISWKGMATNWPVWSNQLEKGLAILTARLFESLLVTVMVRLYTGTFFLVEVVMEIYRKRHVSGGSMIVPCEDDENKGIYTDSPDGAAPSYTIPFSRTVIHNVRAVLMRV